jgi:hypothetical protein
MAGIFISFGVWLARGAWLIGWRLTRPSAPATTRLPDGSAPRLA